MFKPDPAWAGVNNSYTGPSKPDIGQLTQANVLACKDLAFNVVIKVPENGTKEGLLKFFDCFVTTYVSDFQP